MGHQLLLCSSIPHKKYTQTVSTLQALTGLRAPQDIATYTIITKPHNVFKPKVEAGKVNQIEQYYMKCTTTWDDEASKNLNLANPILPGQSEIKVDRLFTGEQIKQWTFHIADIPTAGKNTVLAQNFYESTMVHHHNRVVQTIQNKSPETITLTSAGQNVDLAADTDPTKAIDNGSLDPFQSTKDTDDDLMVIDTEIKPEEKPEQKTQYSVEEKLENKTELSGDNQAAPAELKDSFLQFLEDLGYDVINQYWLKGIRFFYGDIVIEIFKVLIRDDNDNKKSAEDQRIPLKMLDETNTFQIKTYITFPKGTNVDQVSKGSKDLTHLKLTLQNLFELEVPDRMFMDSRVTRSN